MSAERIAGGTGASALSRYDLRLRSLDGDDGPWLCTECTGPTVAAWSVWLHTPEWGPTGGMSRVLCTSHALTLVAVEAREAAAPSGGSEASS